jgi:hypothetical protein
MNVIPRLTRVASHLWREIMNRNAMTSAADEQTKLPTDGAKLLSEWRLVLAALDTILPDRCTLRQVIFFTAIVRSILRGHTVTQQFIFEEFAGTLGRSLTKSGALFFEPSRTYPAALGWLKAVENPADRREKLIELTPEGRGAVRAMLDIIRRYKG